MSTRRTLIVFAGLMVLLGIEIAAAAIGLGRVQTPLILTCALLQAALVMVFLMELNLQGGVIRLFAAGTIFWIFLMFTLTMMDPLTR